LIGWLLVLAVVVTAVRILLESGRGKEVREMSDPTRQEADEVELTRALAQCTGTLDSLVCDLLKYREEKKEHLAIQWGPKTKYVPARDNKLGDIESAITKTKAKIASEIDMLERLWRANQQC
jgi:hypothetical protein